MKSVVFICSAVLAFHSAPLAAQVPERNTQVRYDSVRASHRAQVSKDPCSIATNLKAKDRYLVASPQGFWSAAVLETDPVVVPYDQTRACIQLQGPGGLIRGITLGDFRTLRVQWLNERLLLLSTDVGRVAGVDQLLDVQDMNWLYARTEMVHLVIPPGDTGRLIR